MWNTLRRMMAVRKQHQAFGRGDNRFVLVEDRLCWPFCAATRSSASWQFTTFLNSTDGRSGLEPFGATRAVELLNGWEFNSGHCVCARTNLYG